MINETDTRGGRIRDAIQLRRIGKILSLAADLGVDESAISKWMSNGPISTANVTKLGSVLDVSLDWLLLARGHAESHKVRQYGQEEVALLEMLRRFDVAALRALAAFLAHLR